MGELGGGAPESFSFSLNIYFFSIFCYFKNFLQFCHYKKMVGNRFTEMVFII